MRWREDRRRGGAEIISRKVLTQSDSWRFEALSKVKFNTQTKNFQSFKHFPAFKQRYNDLKTSQVHIL